MSAITLLTNGWVVADSNGSVVIPDGAVAWRGDRIVAVGPAAELGHDFPDAEVLDARQGIVVPGFINLHHHFYSALARGLDPGIPMPDFPAILDVLWWRLDRALDEPTVCLSAAISAAECIRHGCTTVFDHHASPSFIEGSLDTVGTVINDAGLSAVLCYEVTDRNGPDQAAAGVEENLRFIEACRGNDRLRGVVGLHASFTLRDATLQRIANQRPADGGCHVHVAEHPVDVEASRQAFGIDPVARLANFGLLDDRALLAHGIHLDAEAYELIAGYEAVIQHNPESNANNGVGRLDVADVTARGCTVGLGTDGMSSSMLRSLRFAFLTARGATQDPTVGFDALPRLLSVNTRVARRFFDEPRLGELVAGAPADIAVLDALPPTALSADNFFGHLVYGASEFPVRHTIARGRVLLRDGRHTTLDPEAIAAAARKHSPALWDRFHALDAGTSYLG